jgi:hypothetical protein
MADVDIMRAEAIKFAHILDTCPRQYGSYGNKWYQFHNGYDIQRLSSSKCNQITKENPSLFILSSFIFIFISISISIFIQTPSPN